jgi:DNA-binding NarL/FixJ family response regulator
MLGKLLLFAPPDRAAGLADALRSRAEAVDVVHHATEALRKIPGAGYEAAVCMVEAAEDLSIVIRIGNLSEPPPVLMVTSSTQATLRELGRRMGASAVVGSGEGPDAAAAALETVLRTGDLARELRGRSRVAGRLARSVRELSAETRALAEKARGLVSRPPFVTLLAVSECVAPSGPLLHAVAQAGLPPFVRLFPSAETAIEYLEGKGRYADRTRHPLPALVLADEILPERGGLDLLAWIRHRPELGVPSFILLSGSDRPAAVSDRVELGVQACVARTGDLAPLVARVREIHRRWLIAGV